MLLASERTPKRVFSPILEKLCFWGFIWIPFKCRSVWLLPGFPVSTHVWPASSEAIMSLWALVAGLLGLMATASPVLLLAHKLPGVQSHLPGTNLLSLLSQEVSCDSQDGQHGGGIPHKSPWGFTVAHPEQACASSSPLVSGQVPLPESGSRSGSFEPYSRFSVETEAQAGGMVVEPSNSGPDLGSVRRSGSVPLCIAGVVPKPVLVLPEFLVLLEFFLGTYQ